MREKKIVVRLQNGLQARIATEFVQKASSFQSEIILVKNGKPVVGKSIMGVMAITIRNGEEITLTVDGSDEQKAMEVLEGFLLGKKS
ncbi:HPr family phosphocarrier protein [Ectobacillus funiculus]|uniref:HPr family phosphocarrier protein n=1 Tax=Ectobacillus funiculus TaxID=137993 RepID=UPI00397A44F7